MLRKSLFITAIALCIISCSNKTGKVQNETEDQSSYSVEKLMASAESEVGKEIELKGIVTHVCKHSGKKCFLSGETEDLSIQVMAGGNITTFDKELIGSEILVKGTLKEGKRISREDINAQEQALNEELKTANSHEHGEGCNHGEEGENAHQCESKLNSIKQMQAWMEKNNKDFYALYYIDGISYELAKN